MKNVARNSVRVVALTAIALHATALVAMAEPHGVPTAFGAISCLASEASGAPIGAKRQPVAATYQRQTGAKPAAQVTRSERADATFEVRPAAGGALEVSGRSGDLRLKKTVQENGDAWLELATDADTVSIGVTGQRTTVSRGQTRVELKRGDDTAATSGRIRVLLAGSNAILRFRAVAAALIDADDRSPASLAFITSDAIVGLLTGDVGAPRRVAQFMARPGLSKVRRAGMVQDCFYLMETRMMEAWNDYEACVVSVQGWTYWQDMCAYRWVVQVESYWFSFISCSGFNF